MRSNKSHAQKSVFNELFYSIPCSLFCSHLFMAIKRGKHIFRLFLEDGYWMDLLFRSFMAWVMIFLVKYVTHYLDVKKPWTASAGLRFCLQLWYGFFGVVFIDFIVYIWYLDRKDIRMADAPFFDLYTLCICIYIAVINVYYNYRNLIALKVTASGKKQSLAEPVSTSEKESNELALEAKKGNIVYIIIKKSGNIAMNAKGGHLFWLHTTEETKAKLPAQDFFNCRRSQFIHRDLIDKLISNPAEHKLEIVLKAPFNEKIPIPFDRIAGFNEWCAAGKEGSSLL